MRKKIIVHASEAVRIERVKHEPKYTTVRLTCEHKSCGQAIGVIVRYDDSLKGRYARIMHVTNKQHIVDLGAG